MRGIGIGRIYKAMLLIFLFMGIMGTSSAFAITTVFSINYEDPAGAYNSTNNQFLVVALNKASRALEGVITDAGGNPQGPTFVIDAVVSNDLCDANNTLLYCFNDNVAVAYNSRNNQYIVVWEDEDTDNDGSDDDSEIKAVRVDNDGNVLDSPAVVIASSTEDGFRPDVAYNSVNSIFLIVWVSRSFNEMSGRPAVADLSSMGGISHYAPAAGEEYDEQIAAAYSPADNQFLVVWETEYSPDGEVPDIQGRYAAGPTGSPLGADPFVIDADASTDADDPRVAYDSVNNQYLVVWEDDAADEDDEHILGRIVLGNQGGPTGSNIEITSSQGASRDNPDVAFCPAGDKYLVVFENNDDDSVEGQYVSGNGALVGGVILIGPDPGSVSPAFDDGEWQRDDPRVEFNSLNSEFFTYFENDIWYVTVPAGAPYQYEEKIFIEAELVPCEGKPIPTLGQWGAAVLGIILGWVAFLRVRRKKEA